MEKMNVESFNLDHNAVAAPFVRLAGVIKGSADTIRKYDIRFKQPNRELMEINAMHSLEHLMAENIRNHLNCVIDLSPMGCQTGFYLSVINHDDYEGILNALEATLKDTLEAASVPADNPVQCGGADRHDLAGAKFLAKEMLNARDRWSSVFKEA